MTQELIWRRFKPEAIASHAKVGCMILVIRHDHKGYVGHVADISPTHIELTNGADKQRLPFAGGRMDFAVIEVPIPPSFKLGRRLI